MKELIAYIQARLTPHYPADEAEGLAWWILEELTGKSRTELLFDCKGTKNIPNLQIGNPKIDEIIARLLLNEPVQYIFGHTLWMGLDLLVTPATLIPRPETAELVETINKWYMVNDQMVNVLDFCTGSGCVAIALKKAHPGWQVTGIDISAEAIAVARENARRNGVEVNFLVADIFSDEMSQWINKWYMVNDQMVNVVVSNPPYICESEKSSMKPNVLDYEPATALFVPDDEPLRFYRRIAELAKANANANANAIIFEINEAYPAELAAMLSGLGYTDIQISNDIYGKPRIISCRMA